MSETAPYVGRFAPSPTGPLHFGSLLAATASYLQALSAGGRWLIRIEDIDPPREQPGAVPLIMDALDAYGFEWHGSVTFQSQRRQQHLDAIETLQQQGFAYRCGCSRRDLADAPQGALGTIYPGTCRDGTVATRYAIRVRTNDDAVCFSDGLQGPQAQRLESESGDFIIHRRDGLIAYHLAVVVDDAADQITEVVRGIDLLDSTPRQIYLQRLLGLPTPDYRHIPVAANRAGQKLSKQTGAPAIDTAMPAPTLLAAFRALELPVSSDLDGARLPELWNWAVRHWQPARLRGRKRIIRLPDTLAEDQNGLS